jgi:hypothetical protein
MRNFARLNFSNILYLQNLGFSDGLQREGQTGNLIAIKRWGEIRPLNGGT